MKSMPIYHFYFRLKAHIPLREAKRILTPLVKDLYSKIVWWYYVDQHLQGMYEYLMMVVGSYADVYLPEMYMYLVFNYYRYKAEGIETHNYRMWHLICRFVWSIYSFFSHQFVNSRYNSITVGIWCKIFDKKLWLDLSKQTQSRLNMDTVKIAPHTMHFRRNKSAFRSIKILRVWNLPIYEKFTSMQNRLMYLHFVSVFLITIHGKRAYIEK